MLARQRVEAHLAVAVVGDRADVAAGQAGRGDRGLGGGDDLVDRVRDLHAHDLRAALNSRSMCSVRRNTAGPCDGLVGADALEHAGAVVQRVGEHVDLGLVPVDQRRRSSRSSGSVGSASVLACHGTRRSVNRSRWCCRYHGRRTGGADPRRRRRPRRGSRASAPALRIAAVGLALPVPTMSGAEPCTGSNIDGPVRAGLRLADEARPMPPLTAPPRSVRMSPNRLSVTTTS